MKNIFTVSEIITIVMEEVTLLKQKQIYSIKMMNTIFQNLF